MLYVRKNPRPGTLSDVREVTPQSPPQQPGEELMSQADYDAWLAAELAQQVPAPVTRRQLFLWLNSQGITRAAVRAQLEAIADLQARENALIEFEEATTFERTHPLVEQLGSQLGMTAAQIDAGFRIAATL